MGCTHDWASWGTGHAHKVGERVEQCCSCGQQRTITMSAQERERCPCMECDTYTSREMNHNKKGGK